MKQTVTYLIEVVVFFLSAFLTIAVLVALTAVFGLETGSIIGLFLFGLVLLASLVYVFKQMGFYTWDDLSLRPYLLRLSAAVAKAQFRKQEPENIYP